MNKQLAISNTGLLIALLIIAVIVVGIVAVITLDTTGESHSALSSDYVYDLSAFERIDPALILYVESSPVIPTGFQNPVGIVVDHNDYIYVCGDKAVKVFSSNGELLSQIALDKEPSSLAVAVDGMIYIGLGDHIQAYEQSGNRIASWPSLGAKAILTSIAVSKDNVFAADAGNRAVMHYNKQGQIINRIGQKDSERNIGGFIIPSGYFDLAMASDGLLRVVNPGRRRIEAYTVDGDLEFWWGHASVDIEDFCGCCNPANFAIMKNGHFVTVEKGIPRVKVYDADGNFVAVVAGPDELLESPISDQDRTIAFDVAVDNRNRVLILDRINSSVRMFTRK